jgi:hypothetical protein
MIIEKNNLVGDFRSALSGPWRAMVGGWARSPGAVENQPWSWSSSSISIWAQAPETCLLAKIEPQLRPGDRRPGYPDALLW